MKKLILVLNDLGGVGKTSCAGVIHGWLRRRGVSNLLVVTDPEAEEAMPRAEFYDLEDGVETSDVIGFLDRGGVVVMDVQTGGAGSWGEFFVEEDVATLLAELEAELTVVFPVNDEVEGFEPLEKLAEAFSDDADYVVVRTPVDAELEGAFEDSDAAKALEYMGALRVEMPRVPTMLLAELNDAGHDLASGLGQPGQLPRFTRAGLQQWELDFASELAVAEEFLLPGGGTNSASPYRTSRHGRSPKHGGRIELAS